MQRRAKLWQERRKRAASRATALRVDRCEVSRSADKATYKVVIDGFNLHPAIAPPRVTVGSVRVEGLRFQPDGRRIEGVLKERPRPGPVVVDYRFARAVLEREIEWVEPDEDKGR
jgi:hypothetical protein